MPFQQHGTYFYFECSELRHFQSLKIPTVFGSELLLRSPHLFQNATFAKREDHFAWDPQEQGVILGAFYYGYIWTQVGLQFILSLFSSVFYVSSSFDLKNRDGIHCSREKSRKPNIPILKFHIFKPFLPAAKRHGHAEL